MSTMYESARSLIIELAGTIESEARKIGIMRSVEATQTSRWLAEIGKSLRAACAEEDDAVLNELVLHPGSPDDLRAKGWTVGVHNDYRMNGKNHTFWMMTKDFTAIKGEGPDDAFALNVIRKKIQELEAETKP